MASIQNTISPMARELFDALAAAGHRPYFARNVGVTYLGVEAKSMKADAVTPIVLYFVESGGKFRYAQTTDYSFGTRQVIWTFGSTQNVLEFVKMQQFVAEPEIGVFVPPRETFC